MPHYPLLRDPEKAKQTPLIEMTEDQEKRRSRYQETIKKDKEYRDQYRSEFLESASLYNLMQRGTSDVVSNFYLGWARTYIDQSISMMTQAPPDFDFDPGMQDHKLSVIYKSLVSHQLNQSDWTTHGRHWMTDMHVMGPGVLHPFVRTPMRLDRWETESGTIEERVITDLRRQKVGIEHINVMSCWRSCYDTNINDVTSGGMEYVLTRAQFIQDFANVTLPSGKPKYDQKAINSLVECAGSHFKITIQFHDVLNEYVIYALPFGSIEESEVTDMPEYELGVEIHYKPLKRRRYKTKDGTYISSGHNVLGSVPLIFTGFADRYDSNGKNLSLYPMGIPKLIEGPEMIMDAINNMVIDNMRLSNTSLIHYKSTDGKTYPDLDVREFYSGQFIDGEINVQSLGVAKMGDNQAMFEHLRRVFNDLTGINPSLNSDDPSRTAFELAQKQKSNSARAEYRLGGMEIAMKKAGHMLLANCLSELTVPEWENVTQEDADNIVKLIEQGAMTADDFDPEKKRKRVQFFFPVKGKKYREDFSNTKTRTLKSDSSVNTLIEDNSMEGETSYLPATEEYLLPSGRIEDVVCYGTTVNMKRMLGDQRVRDAKEIQESIALAINTQQEKDVIDGLFREYLDVTGIDLKKIFNKNSDESDMLKLAKQALEFAKSSPTPNAGQVPNDPGLMQGQQAIQAPTGNPGAVAPQPASSTAPSNALADYAQGVAR